MDFIDIILGAKLGHSGGGGSGGTSNYNQLSNKPKINNVELSGNKTLDALGINAGSIGFDESEIYTDGSIGAEVSNQKNAIDQKQDATSYVTLSGTIVTQTGADNTMYLCGELAELTFTAPATGITAIRFSSGTTPTVATFSGVTWLNGFDPSAIESSKTYEVNILNGLGVAAWT